MVTKDDVDWSVSAEAILESVSASDIAPTLHGKTYPADQPFLQFLPPNLAESQIWPLFERTVHPKSITKINHI